MANPNPNRGYVMLDKGRGRMTLAGQAINLTCTWAGADKQRLNIDGQAHGSGHLTPNTRKTKDSQPDWRGEWLDGQKRKWLLSAWSKPKDNDPMFSLSLTDPASLATAANAPAGSPAPAPAPSATPASSPASTPAAPADPNSVNIGASDFDNFEISDPFQ
jgi:hypothetical protein